MNKHLPATAITALALLSGCSGQPVEKVELTPAWADRFEASADLKNTMSIHGGASLETYARHYRLVLSDGVTHVEAVYVPPLTPQPKDLSCTNGFGEPVDCPPGPTEAELQRHGPGVHINEPPREIVDGGCRMIKMLIEPATLEVKAARCNGMA